MELQADMIKLNQSVPNKTAAIRLAGQLLVDAGCVEPEYVDAMIARDQDVSTYMGNFIAIPHGTDEGKKHIKKTGISVVQIPMGVDFSEDENTDNTVTVVFGIAGKNNEHLDILSQIALYCSHIENVAKLADAQSPQEVIDLLKEVEN
ncbi:mannitol-specific PTS system IIA component [Ligilactobacillus salitolerans]|uniref:Mannitol-specific phosphotransferase enzyme IIA component n=1 Tax=Ligilactobacillus salitolerans TaxID=1808352 RepID=A0A401IWE8_9LACO|nr:PTS sugar transporter subunit IIA [Ligilactobacillus salitolerans]GBG95842.1 mannitol-specific PTS system IIA component [Ligilactobacillus salitolerans]